ncbi:hypothetical protein ACWIUD_06035 [Helicobacter sp. 23-1044]
MSFRGDNLSLGIHFADLANRHKARTQSPLSLCRFAKNYKSNTANTSIVASLRSQNKAKPKFLYPILRIEILRIAESSEKNTNFAESKQDSSLRVSEASVAIQKKLNPCETPKTRPLRGAKNRIEGCSSATADFLLEAEKRGSPPKSEKRQLLGTQFNSRGERAGGAALLRKDSSESKWQNGENIADSANNILFCHIERSEISQKNRDFSPTAQNDNFVDCHDFATQNLAMTENSALDSVNQINFAESRA